MSNVSDRHNVNVFVAGKSEPLSGQRLAKVGYKSTKKNPAKFPSVCVSVPMISLPVENMERFNGIIQAALENAQDGIIRSLYESSGGKLTSVSDAEISVDACLAFLESTSNRMTEEMLQTWFAENLEENLTVAIAEKHSLGLDDPKVIATVNGVKGMIVDFAGKPRYNPEQIAFIRRALELASEEDDVCKRISSRLDGMEKKPDMSALLGL